MEGEQTFIYEREEGWKTIRPVSSISTANSSIRIKVRADQGGSEVNGSVHWVANNPINVCNEELTRIAMMIWLRGEEEREDRLPAFKLDQLNKMVPLNLMGKSTEETGKECL